MTDYDKKLIELAESLVRWQWYKIDDLIKTADTNEARQRLIDIRFELYDSVLETL